MQTRIVYNRCGDPEVLRLVPFDAGSPSPGQVHVTVQAAGVNPVDWKIRSGLFGPVENEIIPGTDAAGVVDAVGEGVEEEWVGAEVIVYGTDGAYTTLMPAPVTALIAKPAALGWDEAASIGVPAGTAYQALRSLDVRAGDVLLVHGGSGAVGQAAIQHAVRNGATVIATGSADRQERLRALGAVPVTYGHGLLDRVRRTGFQPTAALDAAGTDEAIAVSLETVTDRQRIGTVVRGIDAAQFGITAWSGGSPNPLTGEQLSWRRHGVELTAALASAGSFEIEVGAHYRLRDAAAAQADATSGATRGKVVLHPNDLGGQR